MERSKLHENLLYEKKFYEQELRNQFGLKPHTNVKTLIKYLKNYYDWFYDAGRTDIMLNEKDKRQALLHDMLLNNVYNNFLYNRNMINDPIMEQVNEMKHIQDEKIKRQKELEMLEKLYPDDQKVDIVDYYMKDLILADDVSKQSLHSKPHKDTINISEQYDRHMHMKRDHRDYFKELNDFRMKKNMKYYDNLYEYYNTEPGTPKKQEVETEQPDHAVNYRVPKDYFRKQKLEHYKYYWERPQLREVNSHNIINLGEDDLRVSIENTIEKIHKPFISRGYATYDQKQQDESEMVNKSDYMDTKRSSKISVGKYSEIEDQNLKNQMPELESLMKAMNFDPSVKSQYRTYVSHLKGYKFEKNTTEETNKKLQQKFTFIGNQKSITPINEINIQPFTFPVLTNKKFSQTELKKISQTDLKNTPQIEPQNEEKKIPETVVHTSESEILIADPDPSYFHEGMEKL